MCSHKVSLDLLSHPLNVSEDATMGFLQYSECKALVILRLKLNVVELQSLHDIIDIITNCYIVSFPCLL